MTAPRVSGLVEGEGAGQTGGGGGGEGAAREAMRGRSRRRHPSSWARGCQMPLQKTGGHRGGSGMGEGRGGELGTRDTVQGVVRGRAGGGRVRACKVACKVAHLALAPVEQVEVEERRQPLGTNGSKGVTVRDGRRKKVL